MSESKQDQVGDPDCICAGTGLVCRLGPDSRPDPESIAVCDCVPVKAQADERKWLRASISDQMDWPAARHAFTDAFDVVCPDKEPSKGEKQND